MKQVESQAVGESAPPRAAFTADCLVLLRLILSEDDLDSRKMAVLRAVAERALGIDARAFAVLLPVVAMLGAEEAASARDMFRARPAAERASLARGMLALVLRDELLKPHAEQMRQRAAAILEVSDADMQVH